MPGVTKSNMLQRLLELGKRVLTESDLDRLLTIAIDEAIEITGAERGLIILFDDEGETLFQTARKLKREDLDHPRFEVSRTIIDGVKVSGEVVFLENALKNRALKDSRSASRLGILSVICLPLRRDGEIFGVIYLDIRTIGRAFHDQASQFIEIFADFISLAAHSALESKKLLNRVTELESELRSKNDFEAIIGHHPGMVKILKLVTQIADTDATILIRGASGTGKELIAQALHHHSRRRVKPFVPVNCGALPETLIESELFGHVAGAFTGAVKDKPGWFERAEGGSIFLDEISELVPALQVRLLRILQTGEYSRLGSTEIRYCDVRIIAATNRDLARLMKTGKFREDLFYRLNVIEIDLPLLSERKGDIIILARHFAAKFCRQHGKEELGVSPRAESCLMAYDFPGNIRELENIIHRASVLVEGNTIEPHHFPAVVRGETADHGTADRPSSFKAAKERMIESFERDFIVHCLEAAGGNIRSAAREAGLHYKNFYEKMVKRGIDPHEFKKGK